MKGTVFAASLLPGLSRVETTDIAPGADSEVDSNSESDTISEAVQNAIPSNSTAPAGVGVLQMGVENSFSFRLDAWRYSLERIASSPLVGIGYGPESGLQTAGCGFPASPTSNCGNAHNTYLTPVMRMGGPGLSLLCSH